ncbi:MAG: hypothetical protein H6918_02005 [Sphingomonadaceae bacterium]|nr:hypothetical protein [Sphingomonadaceae bacterium]
MIIKELVSPSENAKILIAQRNDGFFTYCKSFRHDGEWGQTGPDCGIFDSALTAETEAMQKVDWLAGRRQ